MAIVKKLLRLKPTFHVRIDGPVDIEIVHIRGKWVALSFACEKGTNIKWGTTRRVGSKPIKREDNADE